MLKSEFPTLIVGAGTVRTVEQVRLAVESGAAYLVSPGMNADVIAYALSIDCLHLPGVETPTEAETAMGLDCEVLKLFPASHLGGSSYLKALSAPMSGVAFVPAVALT